MAVGERVCCGLGAGQLWGGLFVGAGPRNAVDTYPTMLNCYDLILLNQLKAYMVPNNKIEFATHIETSENRVYRILFGESERLNKMHV